MANPNDFREMSAFALAFATEYKKYMKAHKVRQRQIAEYLGFTEAYVSERVNGKRAIDTNDVDRTGSPHQGNIAPAGIRDSLGGVPARKGHRQEDTGGEGRLSG